MYLMESSISDFRDHISGCNRLVLVGIFFLFLHSCTITTVQNNRGQTAQSQDPQFFNTPVQIVNSEDVHSILLQRKGVQGSLPAIELGSSEQLELSFDLLEFESRTLTLEFVHHTKDWGTSSLAPDSYIDGLQRIYLPFGQVSASRQPLYRAYIYSFPDDQFRFTKSGNYTLRVTDNDTGYLLFSVPFFIYENEGSVAGSIEDLSTSVRKLHKPVGRYTLPDFISQPSFDLHFQFIQNRFLGRSIKNPQTDFSDDNVVYAEAPVQPVFIGDYEFMKLDLSPLSLYNHQIRSFDPASTPMKVSLIDDTDAFHEGDRHSLSLFGSPDRNADAPYTEVTFTLDADIEHEFDAIYLVGDFTNWAIQSDMKMDYSDAIDRWQTTALIKQGQYAYKYIVIRNQQLDDLYFDSLFSRTEQEYLMLVYMRDNREFYDRLLQYGQFYSNN